MKPVVDRFEPHLEDAAVTMILTQIITPKSLKMAASGLVAAGLLASAPAAEAGYKHRVFGGVAAGLVVGALIAGSRVHARPSYYVAPSSCGYLRDRAQYNENIGRLGRASYWWDRYAECRT